MGNAKRINTKIDEVLARLEALDDEDPEDPRVGVTRCALMCKLYSLRVNKAAAEGNAADEIDYQRVLQDWEKRRTQAESVRKNYLLPIILQRLDEWQSAATSIGERQNQPRFADLRKT